MISEICGVPVPSVAEPTTLDELCFTLATAEAEQQAICVAGGGTKLDIGAAPTRLDLLVSVAGMREVIEYNPADLVVRAQAGLPLAELQAIVGASGQRLALDPPEPGATLGGVVAANASGPRRHRYGTVRDVLIGATFVLADGTVAHTGGKVVKNVAGYDLAKLLTGSYGTLAVLADVTLRLHGRPAASVAVHTSITSITEAQQVVARYQSSQLEPSALELRLQLPSTHGAVIALFEGHPVSARSHAEAAAAANPGSTIIDWDERFAAHPWDGGAGFGLRLAFPPAALGPVVSAIAATVGTGTITARAAIGVLELAVAETVSAAEVTSLRTALAPLGAHLVVISAPPAAKTELDVWGPTPGLTLMRSIKNQFDPSHRLAPGRFVGGI